MRKTTNIPRGWTPFNSVKTAYKPVVNAPAQFISKRYCKRCGQTLLYLPTTETGAPNMTLEEEMKLGVCHTCYPIELHEIEKEMKRLQEEELKAAEPTEEEKKVADEKYEAAIQKYMEELRKKSGNQPSTNP